MRTTTAALALLLLPGAALAEQARALPVEFTVHAGSPTWSARPVFGVIDDEAAIVAIRLVDPGDPARVIQELRVSTGQIAPAWYDRWLEAEDYDFDGYNDLAISFRSGTAGVYTDIYRFEPARGRYGEPWLLVSPNPDPERRVVHTEWRNGECCGYRDQVRFLPGKAEPLELRSEHRELDLKTDVRRLTVEERDEKGRMKVVCIRDLLPDGTLKLVKGRREACGSDFDEEDGP